MGGIYLITALLTVFNLAHSAHPDIGLDPLQIIQKYGYPLERHWVTTEDGYILNMHRIPHGINNANESNKPPVLIMHGVLSSAADFINIGPEKAIGFLLADLGYDVWLGNARGTTYSRNHTTLSPEDRDFWLFSWHEIGYYDLAAKIDYILDVTGKKVFYIGHSQGTTTSYVLLSQRPEYNEKMRLVVSLGPAAYMSNMTNIIFKIASLVHNDLATIFEEIGWYELLKHSDIVSKLLIGFCGEDSEVREMCGSLLFMVSGYNPSQLDMALLPVILSNAPAGASYRQFLHYAQEIESGYFRRFDFGMIQNLQIYGQATPPEYDLSAVTAPVALFYSDNDWLCATKDVEQLHSELSNPVLLHKSEDKRFNHLDYLWAVDIVPLLQVDVIDIMSKY